MFRSLLLTSGLFIACLLPATAQKLQLSLEAGLQQGWIPNYTEKGSLPVVVPGTSGFTTVYYTMDVASSYKEKPGAYIKGNLNYAVGDRVQLYHNLNLHLLRYQPKVVIENMRNGAGELEGTGEPSSIHWQTCYQRDANGNTVTNEKGEPVPCAGGDRTFVSSNDERIGRTGVLYLTQELGARYKLLPKLWVQGGMDVSHRLYSQVYVEQLKLNGQGTTGQPSTYTITTEKDKSGDGFNNLALGAHVGAAYDLSHYLSLSLGLQHSFTPIKEANGLSGQNARANLLRLGVQYKLNSR